MNKEGDFVTKKREIRVGKAITNTQIPKKSQVNLKYKSTYEHVNNLISKQIEPSQRKIEFQK